MAPITGRRQNPPRRPTTRSRHYLVHVGDDGHVLLPYPQAKRILDRLKRLALERERPDDSACARFDKATKSGDRASSPARRAPRCNI